MHEYRNQLHSAWLTSATAAPLGMDARTAAADAVSKFRSGLRSPPPESFKGFRYPDGSALRAGSGLTSHSTAVSKGVTGPGLERRDILASYKAEKFGSSGRATHVSTGLTGKAAVTLFTDGHEKENLVQQRRPVSPRLAAKEMLARYGARSPQWDRVTTQALCQPHDGDPARVVKIQSRIRGVLASGKVDADYQSSCTANLSSRFAPSSFRLPSDRVGPLGPARPSELADYRAALMEPGPRAAFVQAALPREAPTRVLSPRSALASVFEPRPTRPGGGAGEGPFERRAEPPPRDDHKEASRAVASPRTSFRLPRPSPAVSSISIHGIAKPSFDMPSAPWDVRRACESPSHLRTPHTSMYDAQASA